MSKANPLAGLIGNYGDSDEESDDGGTPSKAITKPSVGSAPLLSASSAPLLSASSAPLLSASSATGPMYSSEVAPPAAYAAITAPESSAAIHPAPIPHCPWSACYDEGSGFTYYWNQQTNAVTWEAPPEYLLALKLAQQHLNTSGSTEVSAEEWQLYQQALAEKQNSQGKIVPKTAPPKNAKKPTTTPKSKTTKRRLSDDDVVKIELITSYHNSDSESNDEPDSPVKAHATVKPTPPKVPKIHNKKSKKSNHKPMEYGPILPPDQSYSVPIGPELPPVEAVENEPKPLDVKVVSTVAPMEETDASSVKENETEDSQDESDLLTKLKDKAKLLEKLGGEIPVELQKIIQDETSSKPASPKVVEDIKQTNSPIETNIDDLLEEIEKKELPKVVKTKTKIDMFSDAKSNDSTPKGSPRSEGTPPRDEFKPLFPSSKNITEEPPVPASLLSSAANIVQNGVEKEAKEVIPPLPPIEKKSANVYLPDTSEIVESVGRKKLRISNSVLPVKKSETPSYTTKYSQAVEGFAGERTGLGFRNDDEEESPKTNAPAAVAYGNGLLFTKGETLHKEKKEDDLEDLTDLLEAKLKYLNQVQPYALTPVQEMLVQMQTLSAAWSAGALGGQYWRRWAAAAAAALARHEAAAAPPGWMCAFQRSEGRYRYERESDGLVQWEYPAASYMDMDICTTPPPPPAEPKEPPPPPPCAVPPPPRAAPPPPGTPPPPPPPAWLDPPPPGCDDTPPPPLPPEPKQEIGDELMSFYNDIAELEKHTPASPSPAPLPAPLPAPHTAASSPEPPPPPEISEGKEKAKDKDTKTKRKSKVKISSSIGMKHKSVSSLVAKWQQVADEIHSD